MSALALVNAVVPGAPCPDNKDFSKSDALFPPADVSKRLGAEYSEQCRQLCYGSYPAWKEVLARFGELRELLRGRRQR